MLPEPMLDGFALRVGGLTEVVAVKAASSFRLIVTRAPLATTE